MGDNLEKLMQSSSGLNEISQALKVIEYLKDSRRIRLPDYMAAKEYIDNGNISRAYLTVIGYLEKSLNRHQKKAATLKNSLEARTSELEAKSADAEIDRRTGLYNYHKFEDNIDKLTKSNTKYSLIFIDLDHFKNFNDKYSHIIGDTVLKCVGQSIRQHVRAEDGYRYGGEELAILLKDTTKDEAYKIAERLRENFMDSVISCVCQQEPSYAKRLKGEQVTASFGVTERLPGETAKKVIEKADGLMYAAKQAGRNQVMVG